jgi:hypothetical protein
MGQMTRFAWVDVTYQSQEDFRAQRNILCCKHNFYGRPQYDGVLLWTVNFRFGRLEGAFRCYLPHGVVHEVLLVRRMHKIGWRPESSWDGCRVVQEDDYMFISPSYLIRGVLLVNTDLQDLNTEHFFVDDMVDSDIFVRLGN